MKITRVYYNATDEILRLDEINMIRRKNQLVDGVNPPTFYRHVTTTKYYPASSYFPTDRTVATIEVSGDQDTLTIDGGNYQQATWEFGGTTVRCNMTNLPTIGTDV